MAKKLKEWFDRDCAVRIGDAIRVHDPSFDLEGFVDEVESKVPPLELKDRVFVMAAALRDRLPRAYPQAAERLRLSLGPPLPGDTGMFTEGYWLMPIARFVEEFGLDHFDVSMNLCAEITQRNTSEYAVRPYIAADLERALRFAREWATSPNQHVRRLASEGFRPRLPWAKRLDILVEDPEPALALVEPLRADPSRYVRKSVANLINDVSKDHPGRIEALAAEWGRGADETTKWILHHGTRTLRKTK